MALVMKEEIENNKLVFSNQREADDVISKLENFAQAVKHGYVFEETRLADIDIVIKVIAELEIKRKKMHDFLEIESIKTSQLRSNFTEVKRLGEKEISDAVVAARQLNIVRIRTLEGEVRSLDDQIKFLTNDMVRLEKENKDLESERKVAQKEYDEIVEKLNSQLMKKADKQIGLNEIRDCIKDAGEKIVEMEEDIIIQKEDLIHDREEAKQEKQKLVINIEDEDKILKDQQAINDAKRAELEGVLAELKRSKQELKSTKRTWEGLSHELSMLNQTEAELHGKIAREKESIQTIRKQLDELKHSRSQAQLKFDQKEMELTRNMKLVEDKCEYEDGRNNELQVKNKSIEDTERQLKPKVKDLVEREAALSASLKVKKEELREVAEKRADFDRRMQIANDQIVSNTTLHKATMDQLARDFEQCKRLLMETREERDLGREKCDELTAELAEARDEQQRFLEEATATTRKQENTIEDLAQQRDQYHNSIKSCDRQIATLNQTIETETVSFDEMKREKTATVEDLRKQIADLELEVNKHDETLGVERPIYEILKKEHAEKVIECDRLKREVVEIVIDGMTLPEVKKAKVMETEAKVKAANEYIKHFPKLYDALEGDLNNSDKHVDNMKAQWNQERLDVESHIVDTWKKLKQVILENDHFNKTINDVEEKISATERVLAHGEMQQQHIDSQIEEERKEMEDQFAKFLNCQNSIRQKDQSDLDRYTVISQITGDRLDCVSNVLDGLNQELNCMQNFIEVLSGQREEEPEKEEEVVDDEPLLTVNG